MLIDKCKLCVNVRELHDSHLLPRAFYKLAREPESGAPNPVLITARGARFSGDQVSDFLLCSACEQTFNRSGENWVQKNCYRSETRFTVRDSLRSATPLSRQPKIESVSARSLPAKDLNHIYLFRSFCILAGFSSQLALRPRGPDVVTAWFNV